MEKKRQGAALPLPATFVRHRPAPIEALLTFAPMLDETAQFKAPVRSKIVEFRRIFKLAFGAGVSCDQQVNPDFGGPC